MGIDQVRTGRMTARTPLFAVESADWRWINGDE